MPKSSKKTATTSTVSQVNQTAIIDTLKAHGPLSRARIGELTGLSPATVNRLTSALINDRLVEREGQEESTGGRPPLTVRYAGRSRLVAGMQLATDKATGILVNFDGTIIERREIKFTDPAELTIADHELRLQRTMELFDVLLSVAEEKKLPCLAVGVAVPGVVTGPDSVIGSVPELGWPELPLGKLLRQRTSVPVVVENDANAMAIGELRRGAGQDASSLVAVLLGNGLGAGIITNGILHRGSRSEAGEIGYLLMERSSLSRSFSEFGDLEDRVGSEAITRAARENGIEVPPGALVTAHDILVLAASGSCPEAVEISDRILDMVSMAIGAMGVILDPEVIVVGSGREGNSELIIPGVMERLAGRTLRVPTLVPAALGKDSVIVGAAELAVDVVSGLTYVAHQ